MGARKIDLESLGERGMGKSRERKKRSRGDVRATKKIRLVEISHDWEQKKKEERRKGKRRMAEPLNAKGESKNCPGIVGNPDMEKRQERSADQTVRWGRKKSEG